MQSPNEVTVKIFIKYVVESLVVAGAAYLFSRGKIKIYETVTIGLMAGATLLLLDIGSPSVSRAYPYF